MCWLFIVVAQIERNSANIEIWPQLLKNVRLFFHCVEQGSWYILQSNRLSLWWVCISFYHHHWWFIPLIRSWRRPLVGSHPQLSLLRPHPSSIGGHLSQQIATFLQHLYFLFVIFHFCTVRLWSTQSSQATHMNLLMVSNLLVEIAIYSLIFFHSALAYIHILLYG